MVPESLRMVPELLSGLTGFEDLALLSAVVFLEPIVAAPSTVFVPFVEPLCGFLFDADWDWVNGTWFLGGNLHESAMTADVIVSYLFFDSWYALLSSRVRRPGCKG